MAQTASEIIQDRIIRHSVYLERLKGGTVREVLELLTATERDLRSVLRQRLADIADGRTLSFTETQRIETLLQEVQAMRFSAYRAAGRKLTTDLEALGSYEVDWQARMLQESAPVQLNIGTTVALQQVAEIVNSRPFQGLILRDWVADLSAKELGRVRQAINIGMVEGLGIEDIVNRVAGSRSGHIKGVLGISRDHATTWVRTAVSHTANEARDELYKANTDVIQGVVWNSTLDGRTTPDCVVRDGLKYSLPDHKPIGHSVPWRSGPGRLHPRCVTGDTLVCGGFGTRGVSRRFYQGDLVVIRTASGNQLRCTPNHPVLTNCGWVAAGELDKVGHVISNSAADRGYLGGNHAENMPPAIHEVAEAFLGSRDVSSVEVPVSPEDFHGDGIGSKVAIVGSYAELRNRDNAAIGEHPLEDFLSLGLVPSSVAVNGSRYIAPHDVGQGLAADSPVSRVGDLLALFWRSPVHARLLLLAAVAQLVAAIGEHSTYDARRATHAICNAAHPYSVQIERLCGIFVHDHGSAPTRSRNGDTSVSQAIIDNMLRYPEVIRNLAGLHAVVPALRAIFDTHVPAVAARSDAVSFEHLIDGASGDTGMARYLRDGLAGPVFVDDIADFRVCEWHGHVYNLETVGGFYSANNIITHNCRSSSTPHLKSWKQLGVNLKDAPPGTRASMNGQVPGKTTYRSWIKRQPAAIQDDVLGRTRGLALRRGDLSVADLFDDRGRWLTLAEIREREGSF